MPISTSVITGTVAHKHELASSTGGYLAEGLTGITGGSIGEVLTATATDIPVWSANTSNPLIKISKTFADISSGEIDLYTLPQDAALTNVYADITTVFNLSSGVTIGDPGDDDGFLQASDWTAGTGLTGATRGTYVTTFKTMRSTSGTTAIKAYNFNSGVQSCFGQGTVSDGNTSPGNAISNMYSSGSPPVGYGIASVTFNCKTTDPTHSNLLSATIYNSGGVLQQTSSNSINNNTLNSGSYTQMVFTFPGTHTLANGDRIALFNTNGSGNLRQAQEGGFVGANPAMEEYQGGSWNGANTAYQIEQCVTTTQSDTQGEVDVYLQVVN